MADKQRLASYIDDVNIAEHLDDEKLSKIGSDAKAGYELDLGTRVDWDRAMEQWLKLAKQTVEPKSYPWPKASNIKYPLLSTAAMQFGARAYPSLVPSNEKIVKARPIGQDPTGEKADRAERVSEYMSYQLLHEMDGWEEDMDRLLIQLPVVGTMFKKTYWDSVDKKNCSKLILPENIVVNYWTKCLETAERISEIIYMSPRVLKERQLAGTFLDIDLGDAQQPDPDRFQNQKSQPALDETTPYCLIEQHCYLDLDEDDYPEPYCVTFHKESGKVLRIKARFYEEDLVFNEQDKLIKIKPIHYYTKFGFVPNPDGSFYDIGFGCLLGPLNEAVNTVINQLVDSGTLHNLQAGFIGKGLRLRLGESPFTPGEWKTVNGTGDDLRKQIVPLPTKEPSKVLFELMGALITSGKELASVAEIFVGKMPGQNTPATTTMASIEQGMKVFTAVYKRIFRSLSEEFLKLYKLNSIYLEPSDYVAVIDTEIGQDDFNTKDHNIFPGADPQAISSTEKLMKAQGLMELLPSGMLNPVEVIKRVLVAQEQPNWEQLIQPEVLQTGQPPPPPPDPKLQEMQMKGQLEQQKIQMQGAQKQQEMELNSRDRQQQMMMKEQEHAQDMAHKERMNTVDQALAQHKQAIFSVEGQQKLNQQAAEGAQKLQLNEQAAKQKAATAKQQASKPAKGGKK